MITQIGTVVVPVADQDAALAYSTGSLGFEVRLDAEFAPGMRWIEVAVAVRASPVAPDLTSGRPSTTRSGCRRTRVELGPIYGLNSTFGGALVCVRLLAPPRSPAGRVSPYIPGEVAQLHVEGGPGRLLPRADHEPDAHSSRRRVPV